MSVMGYGSPPQEVEIEFWTMQQPQFTDYFKNLIATLKQKILMLR